MSQKETTDAMGRLEVRDWPIANLPKLAELARQAYEQKRLKDCLDLTRAMLLLDPDNAEAQSMRFSIQSEMHRDLDSARAFLKQAQIRKDPEQPSQSQGVPFQTPDSAGALLDPDSHGHEQTERSFLPHFAWRKQSVRWLFGAVALIAVGALVASLPKFRTYSNSVEASPLTRNAVPDKPVATTTGSGEQRDLQVLTPASEPEKAHPASPIAVSAPTVSAVPLNPVPNNAARAVAPGFATPPATAIVQAPAVPLPDQPVAAAKGMLAISSPTSVDIYENDALLGSAPVSLNLSAGEHTIEYRHGSLRRTVTHTIRSNETAKATITFEVSVQINSRPWAEVFIDGTDRKDLGQTPLSNVRVPIGSVLTFENPQFAAKKYRVTGNETGIQIVFP